MEPEELFYN